MKTRHEQYLQYKELVDGGMDNKDILSIFPEHSIFIGEVLHNQTTKV
jgi:hypothetical protein